MRVRITVSMIRPGGESLQPGQVVDVEERIARGWITAGQAEATGTTGEGQRPEPSEPRTETRQAPNTGTTRKPKKTEAE